MSLNKLILALCFTLVFCVTNAQTSEQNDAVYQMKSSLDFHAAQMDSLKTRLKQLKEEMRVLPYWSFGLGGILGMDFSHFSNWAGQGEHNNYSSASASTALNAKANLKGKNFFWRNSGKMTLGWKKLDISGEAGGEFYKTADNININTHAGNNISDDLAVSMLAELKSNLLNESLSPSYLDCSIGLTWTPVEEFLAVMHPVNYELVLSDRDQFESSMGAKLVMEYDHNLTGELSVRSNLSGFMSYEDIEQFTNYTWTSGLNVKLLKSIGLGIEYAIRVSPQETAAIASDEDIQSYVVMGVSYVLP